MRLTLFLSEPWAQGGPSTGAAAAFCQWRYVWPPPLSTPPTRPHPMRFLGLQYQPPGLRRSAPCHQVTGSRFSRDPALSAWAPVPRGALRSIRWLSYACERKPRQGPFARCMPPLASAMPFRGRQAVSKPNASSHLHPMRQLSWRQFPALGMTSGAAHTVCTRPSPKAPPSGRPPPLYFLSPLLSKMDSDDPNYLCAWLAYAASKHCPSVT